MARKLIQDIIVKGKNTDTPRTNPSVGARPAAEKQAPANDPFAKRQNFKSIFPEKTQKIEKKKIDPNDERYFEPEEKISKNSHIFLWVICIIAVGTLLFFVSSFFSTATLTITPKEEPIILGDVYTIMMGTTTPASGLSYRVLSLSKNLSQSLQTSGEQNVARKATGKAVIYNNYSAATQRLINNTRLETVGGLIYRITQSVNVPGIKTVNGVKTPGSVEVTIIADTAGDQFNMKLSDFKGDFTIPGFKNTAQYSGFYARLSADVTGGFIGSAKTVSSDVLSAGRIQLKNDIQTELIKDIYSQNADQNMIFKNDYFIDYTDLPDVSNGTSYSISESATIYAIAFNKSQLAAFVAKNKLGDYDNSNVDAIWGDDMLVMVSGMTTTPWLENTLKAKFTGNAKIVWSYDSAKILNEIKGQNKSILKDIVSENSTSIMEMSASIMPMWETAFPKNIDKIKIVDSVRNAI